MFQATPLKALREGIYLSSGKGFALEVKVDKSIFIHDASGSRKAEVTEDAFGLEIKIMTGVHMQLRKSDKGQILFGVYDLGKDLMTFKAGKILPTATGAHWLQKNQWDGKDGSKAKMNCSFIFEKQGMAHATVFSHKRRLLWHAAGENSALVLTEGSHELRLVKQTPHTAILSVCPLKTSGKLNRVKKIPHKFQMDIIKLQDIKDAMGAMGKTVKDFFSGEDETVMPAALHSFVMELDLFAHPLTRKTPKNFDEIMEEKSGYFLLYEPMQFWKPLNNETSALICTRPGALGKGDSRCVVLYGDGHIATVKLPIEIKTREQVKKFFVKAATEKLKQKAKLLEQVRRPDEPNHK